MVFMRRPTLFSMAWSAPRREESHFPVIVNDLTLGMQVCCFVPVVAALCQIQFRTYKKYISVEADYTTVVANIAMLSFALAR